MSKLDVYARVEPAQQWSERRNRPSCWQDRTVVTVFVNGAWSGMLSVETKHAKELLLMLNSAQMLPDADTAKKTDIKRVDST